MTTVKRPLSLLHFVNARSANVGNGALTEGVEAVINEDIQQPIAWKRLPWDDYTFGLRLFDRDFVGLINEQCDAMIVGGAVTMNGQPHYSDAGMRFNLPLTLWKDIQRPLIFYGLSHRHWAGQTYHHASALRDTLERIVAQPAMLLALRNDGTREWLAATFGIASDKFHVIPDPAVFVLGDADGAFPELESDRRNVILSFNDEDAAMRYGGPDRRLEVLRSMAIAIERMLVRWDDINLVLAPHYFDDHRMLADFVGACRPQIAHQRMISIGSARLNGTRHFYGRYQRADLVISMRVHSMSPCVGLGVPMIPLVTQNRMRDFLADIGLSDLAVDALESDLDERLYRAIECSLSDPGRMRARFAIAREQMRERTREFNRKVEALVTRY